MVKKDPFAKREAKKYDHPIASRAHILDRLKETAEPVAFTRLVKMLLHDNSRDREALRRRLGAMVRDGQLIVDRRRVYALASRLELLTGRVSAHPDGYGFLLQEGTHEDVFLTRRQMRQVFHGDLVKVRVRGQDRRGRSEGEIIEVIERNTKQLVGRYFEESGVAQLEPLNRRINHEVLLKSEVSYQEGQILVVQIIEQPSTYGVVTASVAEVLGDHLTPGIEVEVALRGNDVPTDWPAEVKEAVRQMPSAVSKADKRNRFDLTEIPFVTIDGEDAKDFDDAVFCESNANGGWRLYVAIADVSHYVHLDTALDKAALQRSTSVYFPQYVVPMLPEKLSNGLCSLKPRVERLVMVCEMTISARGKITGYEFYEGYIFSHARLTYTRVAEILQGEASKDRALAELIPHLFELSNLYQALAKTRQARGAMEFDTKELNFHFSADGRVTSIVPRTRNDAHRIIEECMLCANVCAARFIEQHKLPGLFRVHEPPKPEKVAGLSSFLAAFGVQLQADNTSEANITAPDYQRAVDQLRQKENGHILQISLLRSMNQAVYQADNKGHFGLGYAAYTHFTSPIRRYPDLLTHRLIKSVIHSARTSKYVARLGKPVKKTFYPYSLEQIIGLGEHTSFAERRAESAVYEVLEWIKCDFVSARVGDHFDGVITSVTRFGFFVELTDIFVEGLVHVSSLTNDYFRYDEPSQTLVSEKSRSAFGVGDSVQVQLTRVDVDERKVDLELVSHDPLSKPKIKQKRGRQHKNKQDSSKQKTAHKRKTRRRGSRNK